MTDQELDALVVKLFENDRFVKRIAHVTKNLLAEPKSKLSSQIKQELTQYCVEYKQRKMKELRENLERWFNTHLKRFEIDQNTEIFSQHLDTWMDNEMKYAVENVGQQLIKEMLEKKLGTINLSDLLDD